MAKPLETPGCMNRKADTEIPRSLGEHQLAIGGRKRFRGAHPLAELRGEQPRWSASKLQARMATAIDWLLRDAEGPFAAAPPASP